MSHQQASKMTHAHCQTLCKVHTTRTTTATTPPPPRKATSNPWGRAQAAHANKVTQCLKLCWVAVDLQVFTQLRGSLLCFTAAATQAPVLPT
jgi:hypothetical protein